MSPGYSHERELQQHSDQHTSADRRNPALGLSTSLAPDVEPPGARKVP